MREVIKTQTERLIVLLFICLRYILAMAALTALNLLTARLVANDQGPLYVFAWAALLFYGLMSAIFAFHVALFIFWRDK